VLRAPCAPRALEIDLRRELDQATLKDRRRLQPSRPERRVETLNTARVSNVVEVKVRSDPVSLNLERPCRRKSTWLIRAVNSVCDGINGKFTAEFDARPSAAVTLAAGTAYAAVVWMPGTF
jgi:hypothetical protein